MPPGRKVSTNTLLGYEYTTFNGGSPTPKYAVTDWDEGTFWFGKPGVSGYPYLLGKKNVGQGMRLTTYRYQQPILPVGEIWRGGANEQNYNGSVTVPYYNVAGISGLWDPDSRGAEAFSKMKPTKPDFSGLVSLVELRELPFMLRQRISENGLKNVGSYFLALQFGWKPLLRDIVNLVSLQRSAEQTLKQLLRDNGRPVRRSIVLSDSKDNYVSSDGNSYNSVNPILVTQYYTRQPRYRLTTYNQERWWASAQFRYWLPGGPRDIVWRRKMLAAIYGMHPSPSAIYNLVPWSWLADWFTNLGNVIENLDAGVADRLAADWFYMMRERSNIAEQHGTAWFRDRHGNPVTVSGTAHTSATSKYRTKGDPFGLNTNENLLTGMQIAILGALGMSRLR